MASVYVANATRQIHRFTYNTQGRTGSTTQVIAIGGQTQLSGDLSSEDIEGIVLQHSPYGFCSINEVESGNVAKFSGIFYSVGKPIPAEKIRRAMDKVGKRLVATGQEIRKEAAVSLQNQIEVDVIGENNPNMSLNALEMSVEEQPPAAGVADGQSLLEEGIRVVKDPSQATPSRRRSKE